LPLCVHCQPLLQSEFELQSRSTPAGHADWHSDWKAPPSPAPPQQTPPLHVLLPVQRSAGPTHALVLVQKYDALPPSTAPKQHTWVEGSQEALPHVTPGGVMPPELDELPLPEELPLEELTPDELLPPDEPLLDEAAVPDELLPPDEPLLDETPVPDELLPPNEPLLDVAPDPDELPLLDDPTPDELPLPLEPVPEELAAPDEPLLLEPREEPPPLEDALPERPASRPPSAMPSGILRFDPASAEGLPLEPVVPSKPPSSSTTGKLSLVPPHARARATAGPTIQDLPRATWTHLSAFMCQTSSKCQTSSFRIKGGCTFGLAAGSRSV
jgi:hypothetical protein